MIAQMEDTWEATRVDWQWEGCEDGFHGRVGRFRADAASWTRNDRGERCLLLAGLGLFMDERLAPGAAIDFWRHPAARVAIYA